MTTAPVVLFAGKPAERADYARFLPAAAETAGQPIELIMDPEGVDRAGVDYLILAPSGPLSEFTGFTRLKAIMNLWAGVEQALTLPLPEDVPLVRMVEEGLTLGMLDYVSGNVMRHHLGVDPLVGTQAPVPWGSNAPPLAAERRVTVLGTGVLGGACAERLALNGFDVTGWSRSPKDIPGIRNLHGTDGLATALDGAEIVVLLLPDTPATRHILDGPAMARLAPGACIVNAGRGPLIDDAALIAALDAGHLGHATLDVFDVEPLPDDHPFWAHPKVTVTPHIASVTRPRTASEALISQIGRGERGEPFKHIVRRDAGY